MVGPNEGNAMSLISNSISILEMKKRIQNISPDFAKKKPKSCPALSPMRLAQKGTLHRMNTFSFLAS